MFYEDVLRALQNHKVRYLILDGAAVNLHGVPRMTGDLDLAIDMSEENVKALIDAVEEAGLKTAVPVDPRDLAVPSIRKQWREEKNMKALTFQSRDAAAPYREVDIVIENPVDFDLMYHDRVELKADDLTVTVVSLANLIEIKRQTGRKQDISDVEALHKLQAEEEQDD